MFMFNGIGFIVFSLMIAFLPITLLWAIVFSMASGGSFVILIFAYPAFKDFLVYEAHQEKLATDA